MTEGLQGPDHAANSWRGRDNEPPVVGCPRGDWAGSEKALFAHMAAWHPDPNRDDEDGDR